MKWINNFTSNKHVTTIPVFDILVWIVSLRNARKHGYKTKLYCTPKDIPWLEQWQIYSLYDEIDTEFLANEANYPEVDQEKFWSICKLMCINHEFKISNEPFVFADVDLIIYKPLDLQNYDIGVWSPDPYGAAAPIYCDWDFLSTPPNYQLPQFIKDVNHAYNCGILYFKDAATFHIYYQHYLDWTVHNPCQLLVPYKVDTDATLRNIWACNAEQRILAAVADQRRWSVFQVMSEPGIGACKQGIHFYVFRAIWRRMREPEFIAKMPTDIANRYKKEYKSFLQQLWKQLDLNTQFVFHAVSWLVNTIRYDQDPLWY